MSLLILSTLAVAGCSSGGAASRILDAGGGSPDAPGTMAAEVGALPDAPGNTATETGSLPDAPGRDLPHGDGAPSTDLGAPDRPPLDAGTSAGPAYQVDGVGFSRVSLDFLAKGYGDWFCAVLPLPDDQFMLVGTTRTSTAISTIIPPQNEFTLLRVKGNGTVDTTFGDAGKVHVGMSPELLNGCTSAARTPEGKIVVVGQAMATGNQNNNFVVARFLADGSPDPAFGAGGMANTNFPPAAGDASQDDQPRALAVYPDGSLLVGGERPLQIVFPRSSQAILARYLPTGALDPAFGAGGTLALDLAGRGAPPKPYTLFQVDALLALPAGGALVGITAGTANGDDALAVVRLTPEGSVDARFAADGVLWETRAPGNTLVQLAGNADGSLVLFGRGPRGMTLARYTADGLVDPRFGDGGMVATAYPTAGPWQASVLLSPSDGAFLVGLGGSPSATTMGRFWLARYTPDGVLDEGFGWLGWDWYHEGSLAVAYVTAGALLANDDVVLAGYHTTKHDWDPDSAAMRLKKMTP